MCRHEAGEALGALGDQGSLELLRELRDDGREVDVVRETCEIAVERIEWEHGVKRADEKLKKRYELVRINFNFETAGLMKRRETYIT